MAVKPATDTVQERAPPSYLQHGLYSDSPDFEIPMSEMSDVAPDIRIAEDFQESQPATVIRLIARPESVGDEVSTFTNKPSRLAVHSGKLGRAKPKFQPGNMIPEHHSSPDNDGSLKTTDTAIANGGITGRADDSALLDDIQVLPVIYSKQPSQNVRQTSLDESHALAKDNSNESNIPSETEGAVITRTHSDEMRDVDYHGEAQEEKEAQVEGFVRSEIDDAASIDKPRQVSISEDMVDARNPGDTPSGGCPSLSDDQLVRETSAPPRAKNAFKVQKSKGPAYSSRSARNNHTQHHFRSAVRLQPTEEDLLYLLMSRARQNKQLVAQDLQQHAELKHQNDRLVTSQSKLQEALESTQNENEALHVDLNRLHHDLNVFKEKYKKLRTWAREVNTDCSMLKEDSDRMKVTLFKLQSEHVNSQERVREEVESCSQALNVMQSIRQGLAETRKSAETRGLSLRKTEEQLAEKRAELQALKSVEVQHRLYVQKLSERQDRFDRLNIASQTRLTDALKVLNQKLDAEKMTKHGATLNECLQVLQELSNHEAQNKDEREDVRAAINKVEETLSSLQAGVERSVEETGTLTKQEAVLSAIATIRDGMETMRSDVSMYQELQELNARNEEMIKSQNAVQQLFKDDLLCAQSREAETLKHNSLLIQQLADKEQNFTDLREALTNTYTTKVKYMQSEKDTGDKKLEEARNEIVSYQTRIENLEQQLKVDRNHYTDVNSNLQTKHDQELSAMKIENSTKCDVLVAEMTRTIQEREDMITSVGENLQSKQSEIDKTKQELARALNAEQKLMQSLEETLKNKSSAEMDLEKERSNYRELFTKYQNIEAQTSAIPNLRMGLEQKANAVSRLQADLNKLYGVDEQLHQVRNELSSQQDLIDELQKNLHLAKAIQPQVDELNAELTKRGEEMETLHEDLVEARQQAEDFSQLEKSFEDKTTELVKMQSLLEDMQQRCKQIPELDIQNRKLEQQVKRQNNELQLLRKHADKADELEHAIALKDQTLVTYEKELHNVHSLHCQLKAIRDELQCKTQIIDNLTDENAKLKLQQSEYSSDDLANCFTQNTDLSIDSHINDSSENPKAQTVSGWAAGNTSTNPQSGVDPRCIMTATPMDRIHPPKSIKGDSQKVVIPDSQPNLSAEVGSDFESHLQSLRSSYRISSPLSDVDEEFLEQASQVHTKDSGLKVRGLNEIEDDSNGDSGSELSPKSLGQIPRRKLIQSRNPRPGTAMSQEEMLLSTVESKRQGVRSTQYTARGHRKVNRIFAQSESDRLHAGQSSDLNPSPRRLRGDVRNLRRSDAVDNSSDDGDEHHNQTLPHERTRPNSAVKRRTDQDPTTEKQQVKRLKRPNGPLKRFIASSIESISTVPEDDVPNSNGPHRIPSHGISTSSKTSKKSKAACKTSRQDKYTAQFGSSNR